MNDMQNQYLKGVSGLGPQGGAQKQPVYGEFSLKRVRVPTHGKVELRRIRNR